MEYALAQANAAIMNGSLSDPKMAGMAVQIKEINQLAAAHPGFIDRYSPLEFGELRAIADYLQEDERDRIFFNMSIWRDLESLRSFTYETIHRSLISRKADWIQPQDRPSYVLWWHPLKQTLSVKIAAEKLSMLSTGKATSAAFDFNTLFPLPSDADQP